MGESKDQKGEVLVIGGIILIVLAVTADLLGIGGSSGFGWKQVMVLILGIGLVLMGKKCCKCPSKESSNSEDDKPQPPPSDQV